MTELLETYAETLSPGSRRSYVQAARRFLRFSGSSLDRDRLLAYVRHLQAQGYSPNTIRRFTWSPSAACSERAATPGRSSRGSYRR